MVVSSMPWREHSAETSRCRSWSPGSVRSHSWIRSKAACLAAGVEVSRLVGTPPIGTSIEQALSMTRSSPIHHSRPVPSAKSLAT